MATTADTPAFNSLNSKLPDDILYNIFIRNSQFCREELEIMSQGTTGRRSVYRDRGVRVSHVCRFWRAAALSCSVLWDLIHIPSYPTDQVQAYLTRSADRPLTLYFTVMHQSSVSLTAQNIYNTEVFNILQEDLWRIVDLKLLDLGEKRMGDIMPIFLSSAEGLKSLSLSLYYTTFLSPRGPLGRACPLPSENLLIPYQSPSLTELALFGVFPNPEFFKMCRISKLTLSIMKIDRRVFITALTDCAEHLKSLKISNVILSAPPNEPEPQITLTGLEELHFYINESEETGLMKLLKLPLSVPVRSAWSLSQSHFSSRVHDLLSSYLEPWQIHHQNLKIIIDVGKGVFLKNGSFDGEFVRCFQDYDASSSWYILGGLYRFLRQNFPIQGLEVLELYFLDPSLKRDTLLEDAPDHFTMLKEMLPAATALRRLHISFALGEGPTKGKKVDIYLFQIKVTGILESIRLNSEAEGAGPGLLPHLEVVELDGFDLRNRGRSWNMFRDALSRLNRPGLTLKLNRSHDLTDEGIRELASMVDRLYVDGTEKDRVKV